MRNRYLLLVVCLALVLVSQMALAQAPAAPAPAPQKCRMTVETLARAVEPVSHDVKEPAGLPDMVPDPTFKAVIGDCCPGNNVANCPPVAGWRVRCDSPHCETGEFSCLYWR